MDSNIKAVNYFDDGYRIGILVKDDERWQHIIPITIGQETRVLKFKVYYTEDVVTEYLDDAVLKTLAAKVMSLGAQYGITEEARRYLA